MKTLVVLLGLVGCALSAAVQPTARQIIQPIYGQYHAQDQTADGVQPTVRQILIQPIRGQYHAQDPFGQYSYGYNDGLNAKSEVKTADGVTRGFYKLLQADGLPHTIAYVADPVHGYRVNSGAALVQDTPEVAKAKAAHMEAWNTARLESEKSGMWQEMMNVKGESMDKFKNDEMKKEMWEKKEMLEKKDMWEKKDMLENKGDMLKWVSLPEPVKDTPEVELAKREHFRAHELANARLQNENSKATPVIYTSLVGTIYGGEPVVAAVRSYEHGHGSHPKATFKFVNPVEVASPSQASFKFVNSVEPVVTVSQAQSKPSFRFVTPITTAYANAVENYAGVPVVRTAGEPVVRSLDTVYGSHTGNVNTPIIKFVNSVGSLSEADSIPFPVVQRTA